MKDTFLSVEQFKCKYKDIECKFNIYERGNEKYNLLCDTCTNNTDKFKVIEKDVRVIKVTNCKECPFINIMTDGIICSYPEHSKWFVTNKDIDTTIQPFCKLDKLN
ncbi:MAG: hypothetical protein ACRDD7_14100 [Peptostreptococcaceae bacterium]